MYAIFGDAYLDLQLKRSALLLPSCTPSRALTHPLIEVTFSSLRKDSCAEPPSGAWSVHSLAGNDQGLFLMMEMTSLAPLGALTPLFPIRTLLRVQP